MADRFSKVDFLSMWTISALVATQPFSKGFVATRRLLCHAKRPHRSGKTRSRLLWDLIYTFQLFGGASVSELMPSLPTLMGSEFRIKYMSFCAIDPQLLISNNHKQLSELLEVVVEYVKRLSPDRPSVATSPLWSP